MAAAVQLQDDAFGNDHEQERSLETSIPRCFGCGKQTAGDEVIEVLNGIFHRNCFSCQFCRRILEIDRFAIEDGRPCCDPHCNPKGADVQANAIENGSIGTSPGKEKKKEYCYYCGRVIEDSEFVRAFDGIFHSHCFRCQNCQKLLELEACTVVRGKLHCNPTCESLDTHPGRQENRPKYMPHGSEQMVDRVPANRTAKYYEISTPSNNRQEIEQWNPNQSLPNNVEQHDSPLCFTCGEPTQSWDRLESNRKVFHRDCFRCHLCNQPLVKHNFQWADEVPCCRPNCIDYRKAILADSSMYVRTRSLSNSISRAAKPVTFVPTEKAIQPTRKAYESAPVSLGVSQNDLNVYEGSSMQQTKPHEPKSSSGTEQTCLCYHCGKKVYVVEQLHILDRSYHRRCFRCVLCNRTLDIGRYSVHEGYPYCLPHHQYISRNRSASTTNLNSRYSELELVKHPNKQDEQTDTCSDRTPWLQQQLTRSQTAPVLSYQIAPHRSAPEKRRARSPPSPVQRTKIEMVPFADADLRTSATSLATSKSSLQRIEPNELEERYCFTCGRAVRPYVCISLPDRVYHPDCAKCYICQIGLSLSNHRDFGGKLYCSPHFAQALAEFNEFRHKTTVSNATKRSSLASAGRSNLVNSPVIVNTQTWIPNTRSQENAQIDEPSPRTVYVDRSMRQQTDENVSIMSNTLVDSPRIPPRPKQNTQHPVIQLETLQPVRAKTISTHNGQTQTTSTCMVCAKPLLLTTYVNFNGKSIHRDCLRCQACGTSLKQTNLNEFDGKIYCSQDFSKLTEKKTSIVHQETIKLKSTPVSPLNARRMPADKSICFSCGKKVYATESLYVMERVYHKPCFKCMKCNGTLSVENYHVLNGQPYCKSHYRELMHNTGSETNRVQPYTVPPEAPAISQYETPLSMTNYEPVVCRICQNVVHPRDGIHISQQYYHYDCFTCAECKQKLNMGKFEMVQGKAYCSNDFLRLFGRNRGTSYRQSLTHLNEVAQNRAINIQRSYSFKNGRAMVSGQTG